LNEKYATKPARLEAIKKNSRRIWCTLGEVWLHEDMEYETNNTHTLGTKREREAEVAFKETKLRPPKKQKIEKTEKVGDDEGKVDGNLDDEKLPPKNAKKMTDKQVQTLRASMESINGCFDKFKDAIKDLEQQPEPKWLVHVPAYVKTLITKVTMEKTILLSEANATFESDNVTAEFGKVMKEKIAKLKSSIKDVQRRALVQIQEAQSMEDDE